MRRMYILVGIILIAGWLGVQAQTSNGTGGGKWSASATWQGGNVPTGSGTIVIQAADSVYIDVPVTITGTLRSFSGKIGVYDSTKIVFGNGGIYEHDINGGMLPKAVWNAGSTCLIDSLVGNAPANGNQNFYNLTWNCPRQSAGLNLAMNGNTIGGTVRVIQSNLQAFRLTASGVSTTRKTVSINGDVIIDDSTGFFTATGSSGVDTITVNLKGSLTSYGKFQLANGSGASCTWRVGGDVKALGGTFTTHSDSTKPDSLIFVGTTKQSLVKAGTVGSMSNIYFAVQSGSTLDLDTNELGATATIKFSLQPGATLFTGHPNGFEGNLNNTGTILLSPAANYGFDGKVAQTTGFLMPGTVNNLTINNASGVTLAQSTTINGVLTLTAGLFDNTIPFTLGPGGSIVNGGGTLKIPVTLVPKESSGVPRKFFVEQNYPNPFNPTTLISYGIPKDEYVSVKVFNILGQEVRTIVAEKQSAGVYSFSFDGSGLSSGVYLYRIQAGSSVDIKRMMLLK
ncbi:MAG TPA: T9SS type A sorting domain-containing protein [Bacteroidota bacterium]|nr:T9SS type A sorting domain-containing protein [Bacteroidota bacterium]